jgi:hypothetical protein
MIGTRTALAKALSLLERWFAAERVSLGLCIWDIEATVCTWEYPLLMGRREKRGAKALIGTDETHFVESSKETKILLKIPVGRT